MDTLSSEAELNGIDPSLADQIVREWVASASIRAEFGSMARYASYRKAKADGRVRILGGHTHDH